MTIERRGTCSPDTGASWTYFKRSDKSQLMSVHDRWRVHLNRNTQDT
jgi:hypothetical protein